MSKTKKIAILVFLLIGLFALGIGTTETIKVVTNAERKHGNLSQSIFSVKFIGTPTVSDPDRVEARIESDHYAILNVKGLNSTNDIITAQYELQNISPDLAASLAIQTYNSNIEYFSIKSELDKNILEAGEKTIVTVTVQLIKSPIVESECAVVGIGPVQSGI